MRLKRIKLAGFKSFVDPTVIPVQSNLIGIVGPNGCGKSNVIDAVRWVLGEISAKQLRGESMSDVIFNGSSNRKPLGQAIIELTFDNNDGALQGEYAKYNEIAIRREVNRDGSSNYYLNNTRCRRKDIIDLFLGTGLGSNSYAIIEQGMITQLIAAKPEELRLHLEEAAGISKYKERRRETENRIEHTKENLLRLNDIRNEIENQLRVLKKQANAALVYKKLRDEERLVKAKLQALYWYKIKEELTDKQKDIQAAEMSLEEKLAKQRALEALIEELQQKQNNLNDVFNEVQSRFYRLGAEISQLEQKIHYNQERKLQLNQDQQRLENNCCEIQGNQSHDRNQLEMLQLESMQLQPTIEEAKVLYQRAEETLQLSDGVLQDWQTKWDDFNAQSAQATQQLAVEQTRLQHCHAALQRETEMLTRFEQEMEAFDFAALLAEVENLAETEAVLIEQEQESKESLNNVQENIALQRTENQDLTQKIDFLRGGLQKLLGQRTALEVLQRGALVSSNADVRNWLQKNDLISNPLLAQELKIELGWEKAVELVLGNYVEAICIETWEKIPQFLQTLPKCSDKHLNFIVKGAAVFNAGNNLTTKLVDKITSKWSLNELFANVYAVENLSEAMNLREGLSSHESIVTKNGIWLGKTWIRVALANDSKGGVLEREQELRQLHIKIELEQKNVEQIEFSVTAKRQYLLDLEQKQVSLQQQFHGILKQRSEAGNNLNAKKSKLEHLRQRAEQIEQEITTRRAVLNTASQELLELENSSQMLNEGQQKQETKQAELVEQREQCRCSVDAARESLRARKETLDSLQLRYEVTRNQIVHLQQNVERADKQILVFAERRLEIEQSLREISDPETTLTNELEENLEQRLLIEKDLVIARNDVVSGEEKVRIEEKQRAIYLEEVEKIRAQLEKLRVVKQGLEVRGTGYLEQINEIGLQLEEILSVLLSEIEQGVIYPENYQEKLGNIAKRIERLGAINLAAIDEYNHQKERQDYLDKQNADLFAALETLDGAMKKIDEESKEKFQAIYTQVNTNLQNLFPKIFGGGKASLQLTGDNLLEAGVTLMAQPPGKRNSSVHILSGGEKALTAIALIFSIFQINPAPFCLLDEVDAPFDDENVGRFCRLVKEMSVSIQFLYISHNKLTMEMADQLLGVTMHEPGVSRIVAVDIAEAMKMAE